MSSQTLYVPLSVNGDFTDVQAALATPPYHHRSATELNTGNNVDAALRGQKVCGLLRPKDTFPHRVSSPQMSSGPEKSVMFLNVADICSFNLLMR